MIRRPKSRYLLTKKRFIFDTAALTGKEIVVFERVYKGGTVMALLLFTAVGRIFLNNYLLRGLAPPLHMEDNCSKMSVSKSEFGKGVGLYVQRNKGNSDV